MTSYEVNERTREVRVVFRIYLQHCGDEIIHVGLLFVPRGQIDLRRLIMGRVAFPQGANAT